MSFFKSLANKISTVFRDDGLTSAGDNVVFTGDATVVAFVRTDVPKERLKWECQQYFRSKQWKVQHAGKAIKIGFTPQKERILHFAFQSDVPQGRQLFKNVMLDLTEKLARMKLLRTQQKEPFAPEKAPIVLSDDTLLVAQNGSEHNAQQHPSTTVTAQPAPVVVVPRESVSSVVGRAVIFEEEEMGSGDGIDGEEVEEGEEGTGICVCHLGDTIKADQLRSLFFELADSLGATRSQMTEEGKGEYAMELTTQDGQDYTFGVTVGYSTAGERLLHGAFPRDEFGRGFWRKYAILLAQNNCLAGQSIGFQPTPVPTPSSPALNTTTNDTTSDSSTTTNVNIPTVTVTAAEEAPRADLSSEDEILI